MSDLIYHYTSADGLLGILKSNHLRMTNVMFLNDSRELSHGLDVLFDQVIQPISQLGNDYKASSDGLMTVLDAFIEQLKESCPFYTASFCRNGDKLRQWTSYCPNGGYSIGFNRAAIFRLHSFLLNNASIKKAKATNPLIVVAPYANICRTSKKPIELSVPTSPPFCKIKSSN